MIGTKTKALVQNLLSTRLALGGKGGVELAARKVDGGDVVIDGTGVHCAVGVGLPWPL